MHKNKIQQQLEKLIEQHKLDKVLAYLMEQGDYKGATEVLKACYYHNINIYRLEAREGRGNKTESQKKVLDIFQRAMELMPEQKRTVFLALVLKNMHLQYEVFTYSEKDFQEDFLGASQDFAASTKTTKESERIIAHNEGYQASFEALSNHPLSIAIRNKLRYASRRDALEVLTSLWNENDKDGFLYFYDAILPLQNTRQGKNESDLTDETLTRQIETHPGLEFVILRVPHGYDTGGGVDKAHLPPIHILVSNKNKPNDYDHKLEEVEIDKYTEAKEPEVWILTPEGNFSDLGAYMRASLQHRYESKSRGTYNLFTNNALTYATAANVMAAIQNFLSVPKNFQAAAQDRLQEQVESIEKVAFAPIYMNRFLRTQGWSEWAAALTFAFDGQWDSHIVETISLERVAEILVTHGFSHAMNRVENTARSDDDRRALREGFVSGMNQILADMIELSRPGEGILTEDVLNRFERERGFHPDVMLFPVQERKRLAYQDISDIAVANLTSDLMARSYFDEDSGNDEEKAQAQILSKVPAFEIADVMLGADDVTNFMRLYEFYERQNRNSPLAKRLKDKITNAGYYTSPRMIMSRFNNLKFSMVVDPRGDVYISTEHMARYKTGAQIVGDNNLTEAIWAHEIIQGLRFPPSFKDKHDAQVQILTDFLEKKVVAAAFRKEISALPEAEHAPYMAFMRGVLPHLVEQLAEEKGMDQPEIERQKTIASEAFDEASGKKHPKFRRVLDALSAVSGLFSNKGLRR